MMEPFFEHNETEIKALVDRFEEMIKSNGSYFFDVEDFEDIIDYYLEIKTRQGPKKPLIWHRHSIPVPQSSC